MTTMPFGKYKGEPITALPRSYLQWLLRECKNLSGDLKADIKAVLSGRTPPKSMNEQIDDLFNAKYGSK